MTDKQKGAATLVMSLILIMVSTLIIIFAANTGLMINKAIANLTRSSQAFEAGQAGLEYGINYLNTNNAAILASPVGGYLAPYSNSSTTNVALSNNSTFSITYSNPVQNNYTLIKISSVGTSDDGTSVHTVSQLVQFGSLLLNPPTVPITSLGSIALSNNQITTNTSSATTIKSGLGVTLTGSAKTMLNSGISSTAALLKSDVQQNLGSLSGMSSSDFFSSFFGQSQATVKSSAAHYYTNNVTTNYRTLLAGMTGTTIWIDQTAGTAKIDGPTTIGSAANPVLIIINGDAFFQGGAVVYGFVYVFGSGTTSLNGTTIINGGLASTNGVNASVSNQIIYSPSVFTNLQNTSGMRYYAKVPGSWKDF